MTTRAPAVLTNENRWKIFAYYLYSWRSDQDTLFFSDTENCKEYLSRLRGLWYLAVRLPNGAVTWSVIGKTLLRIGFPLSVYRAWPQTGGSSRPLQSAAEQVRAAATMDRKYFASAFLSCWCPFPALDSTIICTCNLGLSVLREGPVKFSERPVLLPGFTN